MDIIALFCEIDDFLLLYEQWLQAKALPRPESEKKRKRSRRLHTSEVMRSWFTFIKASIAPSRIITSKKFVNICAGRFLIG